MAKYTDKTALQAYELIKKGLSNKDTAICLSISDATFYQWQKEKPEFSDTIKKAGVERKLSLIGTIFSASKKTWQAAAWYLERVYPLEFGKKDPKEEFKQLKQEEDDEEVTKKLMEINDRLAEKCGRTNQ